MRKIITNQERKRKKKFKQFVVSGILIFIMFFSVIGYSFQGKDSEDSDKKVIYNNFEFVEQNDFWFTNNGQISFAFKHNPAQTQEIDFNLYGFDISGKPLYVYSEDRDAEIEIYRNLNQIVQRIQPACLNKTEFQLKDCDENLPIKTCADNFIIITEKNMSEITQENNCIFISGNQTKLAELTDVFLFKLLNIKE